MNSEAFNTLVPQKISAMQMWNAIRLALTSPTPPLPQMNPPTGLSVTHFDTGFDIATDFQWFAPSGVAPDQYDFTYNSTGIGLIHLVIAGDDLYEQVSDYYDAEWSIGIIAQKTGYLDSTALTGSGQNPSSSYP